MAKRLIGTATTNSQGIATITYTGTGAGKLQFVAESGGLQSEIYELYDCLKVDDGSSTYANTFGNETGNFTRSSTGATVYYDNSEGENAVQFSFASAVSTGSEVAVDMDLVSCNYAQIQTARYLTGSSGQYESVGIQNQTGKFHIEILEDRTVFYLNNQKLRETTEGETNLESLNIFFRVPAGSTLNFKYKNLIVYPI